RERSRAESFESFWVAGSQVKELKPCEVGRGKQRLCSFRHVVLEFYSANARERRTRGHRTEIDGRVVGAILEREFLNRADRGYGWKAHRNVEPPGNRLDEPAAKVHRRGVIPSVSRRVLGTPESVVRPLQCREPLFQSRHSPIIGRQHHPSQGREPLTS